MTDQWFNEYMFRLVVNKKYITDQVKEILKQTPTRFPLGTRCSLKRIKIKYG